MSVEGRASAEVRSKKRKRFPFRTLREDGDTNLEKSKKPTGSGAWKNLDLILSLQDKDIPNDRKIEIAFNFVGSNFDGQGSTAEPLQAARVTSFLIDWVQPVLISSDACYDHRLWNVLKFCLPKSANSLSHNLLRPITRALIHSSTALDSGNELRERKDSSRFDEAFSECISLIFSLNGRSFNSAGVELWISCAVAACDLVLKIFSSDRRSFSSKDKLLSLIINLLDHFSNFLRFHPSPKSIFRSFVDRLLEPLLELLAILHASISHGDHEPGNRLLSVLENSLYNGLCHSSHINGFSLRNSSLKTEVQERRNLNESYHRHFFKKLQDIINGKRQGLMAGLGHLFQLFVNSLMSQQVVSSSTKIIVNSEKYENLSVDKNESGKALFEVFIQFLEPLLLDFRKFSEIDLSISEESGETRMMGYYTIIRAMNDILGVAIRNKVYDRTRDSPIGDHCNFLKRVYKIIIISWPAMQTMYEISSSEVLGLIGKELILSVGNFLEIEHNTVGDDLMGIWCMMLSYLAIFYCEDYRSDDSISRNQVLTVGCQMVNIYSDIRQASRPIFALCEAMRYFKSYGEVSKTDQFTAFSFQSISPDAFRKAVVTLVCSRDVKFAISNAIKSIPEGQAGECIHQLNSDFKKALSWLKTIPVSNNVQAEIFGLASEVYSVILESLVVTASNSVLVGNSIDELMKTVRTHFQTSVQNKSCDFKEFCVFLTSGTLTDRVTMAETSWIYLCFFRLYVSCRSLYMKVTSLAPSVWLKKSTFSLNKSFEVSSGKDWEKEENCTSEGYFSWIVNPSISLVSVVRSLTECSIRELNLKVLPSLVYVMNVMALQRLIDLNRQLRSFHYLVEKNKQLIQLRADGDLGQLPQKQNKRLKYLIKLTKEETLDLTSLMTEHLHLLEFPKAVRVSTNSKCPADNVWDQGICSLDEGSLPIAIWQLLCQNIDVWSIHASRKSLKAFSSVLIDQWIDYTCNCKHSAGLDTRKQSSIHITIYDVSVEILEDLAFYEQPVLLRHLILRLSSALKNLVHPLVSQSFGVNLDLVNLPCWSDIFSTIDSGGISEGYSAQSLWKSILSHSSSPDVPIDGNVFPLLKPEFSTCERLLYLLCKLPSVMIDQRVLSAIMGYILHLERLLVSALMTSSEYSYLHYDLLKLLICCRRTLKHLLLVSCKDLSTVDLNLGSPSTIQWLLKSVSLVVGLPALHFMENPTSEVNTMFFQLMDHTSYLFAALGDRKINLDYSGGTFDFWKNLKTVAETLVTEIRTDLICGKWTCISCILSCIQGFLWGSVSALEGLDEKFLAENSPISACILELESLTYLFEKFLDSCLMSLIVSDDAHDDADVVCFTLVEDEKRYLLLPILRSLLKEEIIDLSYVVRQIFMSASAVLRFRQLSSFQKAKKRDHFRKYLQSTSAVVLLASSEFILSETDEIFTWMDGILKYLEVLGSCFSEGNLVIANILYPKMVTMHLKAMAKCISSGSKTRVAPNRLDDDTYMSSLVPHRQDELVGRIRTSFKKLIRKPLQSGFGLLVQILESAMVNMSEGDPIVASGLEFIDLVFDSFSGEKPFGIIKDHASTLFASLFNIILHFQSPKIFFLEANTCDQRKVDFDRGSAILMCVEILRKFSRKNTQLKMDSCFVGQSLHVPFSLFKHFREKYLSFVKDFGHRAIDSRYFVDLYAACCRLLCTIVRHQKSETAQCIALLEDSVNSLLRCLVSSDDENALQKGCHCVFDTKEALMCANFLRRVYEEIKQQKDTIGSYASQFLADYLCLCQGLKREVDEALRPGVYALIDTCSPGDFQKLHTILGEGQCRRTLAALRSEYRLYFQYQGKI